MKLFEFDKSFETLQPSLFDPNAKTNIIGTDEAGRGPAAGPVYASAVYFLKTDIEIFSILNDSKQLSEKMRGDLYGPITENSIYSIVSSSVEQIEELNILQASLLAMKTACLNVISQLPEGQNLVLVDGNRLIKNFPYPQKTIIKGDTISASIAAASVLAKVARDRHMEKLSKEFPLYGWEKNKGYLSSDHIKAIRKHGPCIHHRQKFLRKLMSETSINVQK